MSGMISNDRENDLEAELNKGALWAVTYGDLMSYLMIFFMVLFSLYVNKASGARPLEASAQLVNLQKVFGGKIDPTLLERIKNYKKEESVALKLKDSPEVQALSEFVQIQTGDEFIRLVSAGIHLVSTRTSGIGRKGPVPHEHSSGHRQRHPQRHCHRRPHRHRPHPHAAFPRRSFFVVRPRL